MSWHDIPEWLRLVVVASLGALGTIVSGGIVARSDSKRTRADDRGLLTTQALERLSHVEEQLGVALQSLAQERRYCDERMQAVQDHYEERLKSRDILIGELRESVNSKEATLNSALNRISQLEQTVGQGL